MMKKLHIAIATAVISVGLVASSSAAIKSVGDPGRSWAQPDDGTLGQHIQQFIDAAPNEIPSYLVKNTYGQLTTVDPTCKSVDDAKCANAELNYSAVLPRCENETAINCTVDFGIVSESGVKTSATFKTTNPFKFC